MPKNYHNNYNNRAGNYTQEKLPTNITEERIASVISSKDASLIVEVSQELGEHFVDYKSYGKKELTTSKIRNIFDSLKKMEMKWKGKETVNDLILLQPKLSYSAHRDQTPESAKNFVKIILWSIKEVLKSKENETDLNLKFKNFCKFYEAILCYHKANGGK